MKKIFSLVSFLYNHKFIRYLFVGGSTFFIDLGTLVLLHGHLNFGLRLSTSIAYWLSVSFNFCMNRWWTFSASENKKLHQHMLTYGVLLVFNYLFTVLSMGILSRHINYAIAKPIVVITQTFWTYPIYKNIIFGVRHLPAADTTT